MCAIAALVSKDGSDVSRNMGLMLQTLEHRGCDWVRFSVSGHVAGAKSVDEASFSGLRGSAGLAEAHLKRWDSERDPEYPEGLFTAVDGRLYGFEGFSGGQGVPFQPEAPETEVFAQAVAGSPEVGLVEAVERALSRADGAYAVGAFRAGRMVFGRDPLGVKSLYFGGSGVYLGLASERKALWRIGIGEVRPFPPGCIGELLPDGIRFRPFAVLKRPEAEPFTPEDASVRLEEALRGSLRRRLRYVGRSALSFSGGLDSSVLARMITDLGGDVLLCVAGLEGCHDIGVAEDSAEALGLEIKVCSLGIDEVGDLVPKVVYAVEEPDVMKIGAALPLYVASETVSRGGVKVIFSGQGADELFCGYNRCLAVYDRLGYDGLAEEVWKDVTRLHEVNLQRDEAVTAANGVHLEVPFLDLDLVRTALSFPVSLNVRGSDDRLRKHVLRRLAERLGLPVRIVEMPKKAAQYGSGVDQALRRIAKDEGFRSAAEYLRSVFHEVFGPNPVRDSAKQPSAGLEAF